MTSSSNYDTPQEEFWAGTFGTDYSGRNNSPQLLAANLKFFATALRRAGDVSSCVELGANIGMNLQALRLLYPQIGLKAVEINPRAAQILANAIGPENVFQGSILDYPVCPPSELALVKGVLIHINPEKLPSVYGTLYRITSRFILVCEYYNPTPVCVPYRGHQDRLFKRDFAGELMDTYADLRLVDYGFAYHRDPACPQDDITWFLLEKRT